MVQQRFKDYKPLNAAEYSTLTWNLKLVKEKRGGVGDVVSTITESMRHHTCEATSRSAHGDGTLFLSLLRTGVAPVWDSQWTERCRDCTMLRATALCLLWSSWQNVNRHFPPAVRKVRLGNECYLYRGTSKTNNQATPTTENEDKIKPQQSKMLVARLGIF